MTAEGLYQLLKRGLVFQISVAAPQSNENVLTKRYISCRLLSINTAVITQNAIVGEMDNAQNNKYGWM